MMRFEVFIFVFVFVFVSDVVAPPPLEVELRAEKEYMMLQKLSAEKLEDTLDEFGDNLIPDVSDENVIEDTETDEPIELKKDDEVDEFVPMSLPNSFDKYDLNDDDFIDENELISVTGVIENNKKAMEAADSDGDGMLSRSEFERGPWDLNEDSSSESEDTESDNTLENETESEIIDYDADEFKKILSKRDVRLYARKDRDDRNEDDGMKTNLVEKSDRRRYEILDESNRQRENELFDENDRRKYGVYNIHDEDDDNIKEKKEFKSRSKVDDN